MSQKPYYISISVLRFFASWGVILHHVAFQVLISHHSQLDTDWWVANVLRSITLLNVPLFILLSGALHLQHEQSFPKMLSKAKKMFFLYVFWSFFYIGAHVFLLYEEFDIFKALQQFLTARAEYHLFFVPIIVGLYLCTPFLYSFFKNADSHKQKMWLTLAFIFSSYTWLIEDVLQKKAFGEYEVLTYFLRYLIFYLLGIKLMTRVKQLSKKTLVALVFSFVVYVVFSSTLVFFLSKSISQSTWDIWLDRYYSPQVILMASAIFLLVKNIAWEKISFLKNLLPFMENWNHHSITIYFIHPLFLHLLFLGSVRWHFIPLVWEWRSLFFYTFIVGFLSYLAAKGISFFRPKTKHVFVSNQDKVRDFTE